MFAFLFGFLAGSIFGMFIFALFYAGKDQEYEEITEDKRR